MHISEKLLLLCSRKPGHDDYRSLNESSSDNALLSLCKAFPDFMKAIIDKNILDFGCGPGYQTIALAMSGAKNVLGIDINEKYLKMGQESAKKLGVLNKIEWSDNLKERHRGKFDIVISKDSMEHFRDPVSILNIMKSALKSGGKMLITFGPPWYAPYGSHMNYFTKLPYVNVMFSEKTIMNVRSCFRNDGAAKYEEVEGGLNKMSISKFENIIRQSNTKIIYKKYNCVKGIDFFATIPFLREFFINQVNCVLINS